jgi:hypothetical protein
MASIMKIFQGRKVIAILFQCSGVVLLIRLNTVVDIITSVVTFLLTKAEITTAIFSGKNPQKEKLSDTENKY